MASAIRKLTGNTAVWEKVNNRKGSAICLKCQILFWLGFGPSARGLRVAELFPDVAFALCDGSPCLVPMAQLGQPPVPNCSHWPRFVVLPMPYDAAVKATRHGIEGRARLFGWDQDARSAFGRAGGRLLVDYWLCVQYQFARGEDAGKWAVGDRKDRPYFVPTPACLLAFHFRSGRGIDGIWTSADRVFSLPVLALPDGIVENHGPSECNFGRCGASNSQRRGRGPRGCSGARCCAIQDPGGCDPPAPRRRLMPG